VLDPFCGCGTAIAVAERLKRRWAGIDVTHLALNIVRERMKAAAFEVHGEPTDRSGAARLAQDDPAQFQWWILGRAGARPASHRKGSDPSLAGVDGEIFFADASGSDRRVVVSVKHERLTTTTVRELRAMATRNDAAIGVLLTLHPPTAAMTAEAARAGFHAPSSSGARHPRIQILTIDDVLRGRRIDWPETAKVARDRIFPAIASTRPPPSTETASKRLG
jgi:hypothetical protein